MSNGGRVYETTGLHHEPSSFSVEWQKAKGSAVARYNGAEVALVERENIMTLVPLGKYDERSVAETNSKVLILSDYAQRHRNISFTESSQFKRAAFDIFQHPDRNVMTGDVSKKVVEFSEDEWRQDFPAWL